MDLDQLVAEQPEMFRGIYRIGEPRRKQSPVVFSRENIAGVFREIQVLIEQHYEEVAQFKAVQKLDPDWDAYERLEKTGKLWVMTARVDGNLVGYIVMIVGMHLHYKSLITATEDISFLLPAYRKGLTGYKLFSKTAKAMAALGVQMCVFRTKALKDHSKLFERLGFEPHDVVYAKILER
jgi:hypothetical protein